MPKRKSSGNTPRTVRASGGRARGRPKQDRVADLEKGLLAVALQEFIVHGYGGASLSRIVKSAGVSKTTLYSRFDSKEALFRAIMRDEIQRLDAATALQPAGQRPGLEEGLKSYANHMMRLNLQGELLAVNRLIASEAHRFPEVAAAAAERAALGIKRISTFIRECAIADGLPCKDPEAAAEAFIFMLRGWHAHAMLLNGKVSTANRQRWIERAVHALIASRSEW
ncbi:MAG: TetR/AcrR family transcriptional regulator [Sinimarinibacterium flocculans]|uniref:TetR/AcrR family transcriptional regulator n=1 Tax=Sinimarinibacterium flocculans TaxID=985250 RepID=UPI003C5551DA